MSNEESRLEQLVIELKSGNKNVINEIVEGHIRLAINVSKQIARNAPNREEDIVGSGLHGLIESVHKAADKLEDNHITRWIVSHVRHAALLELVEGVLIPIPCSSKRRHGKEYKQRIFKEPSKLHDFSQIEVQEFIEELDEIDSEIVKLRYEMWNDSEIASKLSLSKSTISERRERIRKTYIRRLACGN